jgi:alpha-1,3-mannosyltransferase
LAQYIFIGLYLLFLSSVFAIYKQTRRVPPVAYFLMCLTSHRIHSIFVLRLFNDPIAMLFLYLSIVCLTQRFWRVGCIAFSIAVSIKMNILLFAPGLFVILVLSTGILNTFKYIFLCALVQVCPAKSDA